MPNTLLLKHEDTDAPTPTNTIRPPGAPGRLQWPAAAGGDAVTGNNSKAAALAAASPAEADAAVYDAALKQLASAVLQQA